MDVPEVVWLASPISPRSPRDIEDTALDAIKEDMWLAAIAKASGFELSRFKETVAEYLARQVMR